MNIETEAMRVAREHPQFRKLHDLMDEPANMRPQYAPILLRLIELYGAQMFVQGQMYGKTDLDVGTPEVRRA